MEQSPQYVIEMLHITKEFPGIKANDDITLQLRKGEIHALLGENGAGKSTLMSVLFGLYQPEEGEIRKNGKPVKINDPNDATALGIGMVHQHFKLIDVFTVLDNIILGAEDTKMGFLQKKAARQKVQDLSQRYGLRVDLDARIEDITVGMQQRVEILKMLYRDNEILIFDEPTAVLTPQEIQELAKDIIFGQMRLIIAPMQMLEEHFGKISKGDLHTKVSLAEDGTEIGELVAAANRMQDMFSRYIKEVETVLYELSQGNLGQTVSDNFTGDFVKIRESLIAILSSYKASFEEINNAAFEVSNGSEQIAMSSQTLSEGATEQASTIQELTANVNEVSARISETAENAEDVKKAAVEMTEVIQTGNQSLSQLAGTMKELNKYSSDIYKIVKTIDNIAFQTNILALNASVEAARAEQNGASFSVVADEVRALAAQSAKSAQATAQLIEDTLNAIKTGVETAVSTEELLSAIVGRAENVKHRVIKITEAMESDSVAVQQALASLEQLSSIVQANSANAEETAAASEEISAQASAMMDLVRRFS